MAAGLEFFVPVDSFTGEPSLRHIRHDEVEAQYIKELGWLDWTQLEDRIVFPVWLWAPWFWDDAARGFPTIRYTGVETE